MSHRFNRTAALAGVLALALPALASAKTTAGSGPITGLGVNLGVTGDMLFLPPISVGSSTELPIVSLPSAGFGIRMGGYEGFSWEPQLELGYTSSSTDQNPSTGISVFGLGLGAALRYSLVHSRTGAFYIGALPQIDYVQLTPKGGDSTTGFGFEIKGLAGVEWAPSTEMPNVSVGLEGQIPGITFAQEKTSVSYTNPQTQQTSSTTVTSTTFGLVLGSPRLVATLHYYY